MTTLDEAVKVAFGTADEDHYLWQTEAPLVSELERELVRTAFEPLGERVLDLGCAEGATLKHLGEPEGAVGVDLIEVKLRFAREHVAGARFVQASAYELPFEAGAFDHVLVRDVLHHIDEPERVMRECARVLAPGGRLDVLEPCRNNPLILAHALTIRAERGELRSTARFLETLARGTFHDSIVRPLQPFPVHRLVLHPVIGLPSLGRHPLARSVIQAFERMCGHLVPRAAWAYLHLRAHKR